MFRQSSIVAAVVLIFAALSFGQVTDSFMNQGAMRTFIVYAPSGTVNPALVINMHGLGSNASQQLLLSGFNTIANRDKFIVVYPNGISNQWDLIGDRDVIFISALIDTVNARYSIDPERVFATGMSMGGYMSHRLGCMLSTRIAAIGSVAGLNASYNCNPSRSVPVLQIHGTADSVVKYSGVAATISGWVTRNGCPSAAVTVDPYPASNPNSVVKKESFGPCEESSEVVLLTVEGDGHTWPGANWGNATMDINASDEIWAFFKKHPLPGASHSIERKHFLADKNIPRWGSSVGKSDIFTFDGKVIYSGILLTDKKMSSLVGGVYLIRTKTPDGVSFQTILPQIKR